jgi:tetratricopeptide (TPR) repeat protein
MKPLSRKLAGVLVSAFCVFAVANAAVSAQSSTESSEADALAAVKLSTNPTTKLTAAEDFIARFPNSTARVSVAEVIAGEILKVKNGMVALALLERAQAIFTSTEEREVLKPAALEAYVIGNRPDDAFALAADMLAKNADDLQVLARMTQLGTEEASRKNRKYANVSLQYGLKAIALLEAGTKPVSLADEEWTAQRAKLDRLYQQTAILYLAAGNAQEAKARLTKASTLSPHDPSNYALLARVINADYLAQQEAYVAMKDAGSKQEAQKKLDELLDSMIDAFARAVGLATGRVEYQPLLQSVIPDLTAYYKTRHNQSIKGLQELINRYRPAQ